MYSRRFGFFSHKDVSPDRLIGYFCIDQLGIDCHNIRIPVCIFHKQRVGTSVGTMPDNGHLPRITPCYAILQKVYSIHRTVHKVIEDCLSFYIGKLKSAAIRLHEPHHRNRRISLFPFRQSCTIMRIKLHIADKSSFGSAANPYTCPQ